MSQNRRTILKKQEANSNNFSNKENPLTESELEVFRNDMLYSHNTTRENHNSPPMKLKRELNEMAQSWANKLALMEDLEHSPELHRVSKEFDYVGENIFFKIVPHHTVAAAEKYIIPSREVIKEWYVEKAFYDPFKPGHSDVTSNFTQILWKASSYLGVGIFRQINSRKSIFYVVCNYGPAGNIGHPIQYDFNVQLIDEEHLDYRAKFDPLKKPIYDCPLNENDEQKFEVEVLESHNEYRKAHKATPLELNVTLSSMAKKWCTYLAQVNKLEHSPEELRILEGYEYIGENIHFTMVPFATVEEAREHVITGAKVVDKWYSEIDNYDFFCPSYQENAGHFTQVVWRETKCIGVGIQRRIQGRRALFYIVVIYGPGGNFGTEEQYEINVLPKKK